MIGSIYNGVLGLGYLGAFSLGYVFMDVKPAPGIIGSHAMNRERRRGHGQGQVASRLWAVLPGSVGEFATGESAVEESVSTGWGWGWRV